MKRNIWIVGVLAGILGLVQGCSRNGDEDVIRIGATLPLSGDAALWGQNTKKGIELALEEINSSGGVLGKKIEVVYEDTQALPRKGVDAYKKLTSIDQVSAIIDDSVSGVTLAMAPLAERDKVVILATGATSPEITNAGDYIFRIWNSDTYESEVATEYIYEQLKKESVAILFINNDYGKGLERAFAKNLTTLGGCISVSQAFSQGESNLRAQITKIKALNPDVIYLVAYPKEAPFAIQQIRELGLQQQIMGTVALYDESIITNSRGAAEGMLVPYPQEPSGDTRTSFVHQYQKRYGESPGITSDVGYDSLRMIVRAIKASNGFSGSDIQRGLMSLKDFNGASGIMTFDSNGDVHKPIIMTKVSNDSFQQVSSNDR